MTEETGFPTYQPPPVTPPAPDPAPVDPPAPEAPSVAPEPPEDHVEEIVRDAGDVAEVAAAVAEPFIPLEGVAPWLRELLLSYHHRLTKLEG